MYRADTHEDVVRLTDPFEVKVIDALVEASGIPHEKGSAEIPIPKKLFPQTKWVLSDEYRRRVQEAKARRERTAYQDGSTAARSGSALVEPSARYHALSRRTGAS